MKIVDISKVCGFDGVGNRIIKLCSEGFRVNLLVLLTCLFHLVGIRVNGSLQMLFLYLRMMTINSK